MHSDKDPAKWWSGSIQWQVFWCVAAAVAVYVTAIFQTGDLLRGGVIVGNALWHETAHAAMSWLTGGTIQEFVVNSDGSGHVSHSHPDENMQVFVSGAGMIGQAIVAAFTAYAAITRRYMHFTFLFWAAGCLITGAFFATGTLACTSLLSTGIIALTLAFIPLHAGFKAPFLILAAFLAVHGTLLGLDYAWVAEITHEGETVLSDSGQIAQALNVDVNQVGNRLLGIMIFVFLVSAACISHFLGKNI